MKLLIGLQQSQMMTMKSASQNDLAVSSNRSYTNFLKDLDVSIQASMRVVSYGMGVAVSTQSPKEVGTQCIVNLMLFS